MLRWERGALETFVVTVNAVALLRLTKAAPRRQDGDCQVVPLQDLFLWEDGWGPDCANQLDSVGGDGAMVAPTENPQPLSSMEANMSQCDEDQIITQLHRLQAITPESIVLLVTEEDLDLLCGQVRDSLDALAHVAASCAALGDDDRDIYQALLRGVATLHADLCAPAQAGSGGMRARFLQHSACLRNLSRQLQECAGPRDWTDSEDERGVCATYERIATCYHATTAVACGSEAADLMRQLVASVASSVLGKLRCKEMEQLEQQVQSEQPEQTEQPKQTEQPQKINAKPQPEHTSFSPHHISVSILILTICSTIFELCG